MVLKEPVPEFSRPLDVARVASAGTNEKIAANAVECGRLAARLGIPALHVLEAELLARPWRGGGLKLTGVIVADLEQVSVVSLEPFRHTVSLELERYFLPRPTESEASDDGIDAIAGGHVDLGEVVAETLALELDPYPRKPGEVFSPERAEDDLSGNGAFASLEALKPRKNKRK
jgi:uncharacterized metal-binding protein YceD (DUF177 family)